MTLNVAMREGEFNVTLDLGTRFLKAARSGPNDCRGRVIKRGRTAGFPKRA